MNLISFVDELVKLGGARPLFRKFSAEGDTDAVEIPHGMMGDGAAPEADRVDPSESATRLPATSYLAPDLETGHLGKVTEPKQPIDKDRFNRAYREQR